MPDAFLLIGEKKRALPVRGEYAVGEQAHGRGTGSFFPAWPPSSFCSNQGWARPRPHIHSRTWTVLGHRVAASSALVWMEFWGFLTLMLLLVG